MIPSIPVLREQTMALATQAAGVNHQTLNDTEGASFLNTIEGVKSCVCKCMLELCTKQNSLSSQEENYKLSFGNDIEELEVLRKTLEKLQSPFKTTGITSIAVKTTTGFYATARLVDATATGRDVKIAAANALNVPFESIVAVGIGGNFYDDNVLICRELRGIGAVHVITKQ